MRSNILALRQRKTDLTKAQRALLDLISKEERDFSEAEGAQFNDNIKKMELLESQLVREENQLELERSQAALPDENAAFTRHTGIDVPNAGDDPNRNRQSTPFASFGEQLLAVARAAHPMTRVDPRLIPAAFGAAA